MTKIKMPTDRIIDSTDTNEYAEGMRDETIDEEYLIDTEIAVDDFIPDGIDETGEGERPIYDEQGFDYNPQ